MPKGIDTLFKTPEIKEEPKNTKANKPAPVVDHGENEVVASGRKQNEGFVQNYALRLPKDFYKALKSYCDQKETTVNTIIYNTLKSRFENDPDFKEAYEYANKK